MQNAMLVEFGIWERREEEGGREEARSSGRAEFVRTNARSAKRASVRCRSVAGKGGDHGKYKFSMVFAHGSSQSSDYRT